MASRHGTTVFIRPADILRIGCPVIPDHKKPVRWSYNNQTLKEASGLQHRMLAGGRVLEVNTFQVNFSGLYRCQTLTNSSRQMLSAWIYVRTEEFAWRFGDWTSCSASCGNGGTWLRRIRCVSLEGQEVQPIMCQHIPRPVAASVPCNRQDCPPRSHLVTMGVF
ncbi:hypothetical protein LDENG_00237080 [Lucifuga dentata]|nr:hypothetical protein LDENG_00237080 [Lucifuga dentata]